MIFVARSLCGIGPVSICVNAASWDPYTYALGFVRQGFNGVPEVVTVTDTDRAATPSSMDWSDLGSTSSVNELVVLATWKFVRYTGYKPNNVSSDLKHVSWVDRRPLLDAVDWTTKKSGDASEEPETVGFVLGIFNNLVS